MSSTTDKIKGLANEAVGNIKQGVGSATGNEKLQAEGKAQELKGEAQKTVGDAKDGDQGRGSERSRRRQEDLTIRPDGQSGEGSISPLTVDRRPCDVRLRQNQRPNNDSEGRDRDPDSGPVPGSVRRQDGSGPRPSIGSRMEMCP